MKKTNAIRILESKNIQFDFSEYEYDENKLDAVFVAEKIDADPEQVFKTLVTVGSDNNNYVFVIPGIYELNLKKAASAVSVKKIEMIKVNEIQNITGYLRGGCSPIGMKKLLPTFIDESAQIYDKIFVSAGVRGMQIFLCPNDIAELINAQFFDLI